MQLTFLGGADEVGASSTLVEIGGKTLLVDAGIRISPRSNRGIQDDQLPDLHPIVEKGGPDYILVTHAHTDHTGALPLVVERYPHAPIIATRPTIALTRILQIDARRIMQGKQDEEGELPIFDEVASQRLLDAMQTVEFNQAIRLGDGLQVTYYAAGHIAGAATLVLESAEGTLVMSGDMSVNPQRTVVSADIPRVKADALVLESTYGGKLHANRVAEEKRLIDTLKRVTERGGKVLIPAFALGRAQEVLQILLAFRDDLDVPVYADGMVRSVCEAYAGFSDLLPERTVKVAKEEHLFYRGKIRPIRSATHRNEVVNTDTPMVIVASSGMLTGGASVVYARAMASDERNAILLTGYQDEESPGRAMQRMIARRQAGEPATLKIDGKTITLRCEVDTYSLSAHADESELINIAEALKVDEVMLVHGDPGARHSLATGLRQRGKRVLLPRIGQTETFTFAARPWALGQVKSGKETRPFDSKELWMQLKGQAGNFYSAQELAQMWWGDSSRAKEVVSLLNKDSLYFAPDWRNKSTFCVRSEAQVGQVQRQRAIMLANPDIVGKLIVMRNSNNQPRIAVVRAAYEDSFDAQVQGARGTQNPADALLWVVGQWEGYPEGESTRGQLSELLKKARPLQDMLLPFAVRQALAEAGEPVNPETLLPDPLPEGMRYDEALVAIVMALAGDGAELVQGGLIPRRAMQDGPVEQNEAREMAFAAFPPEARLRKVGMEIHRRRLILTFDFPDIAMRVYADELNKVIDMTGWDVQVKPGVNQQALSMALDELLPDGARIIKGPSFYIDQREVQVEVQGVADTAEFERQYLNLTGFRLRTAGRSIEAREVAEVVSAAPNNGQEQMEINAAYAVIRVALEDYGLYKTSLKQGYIILSFISPQVGERHQATIQRLAEETGYPISVHPHPNQQKILQIAQQLARDAGWQIRKGPGIHVDRAEVSMSLGQTPSEADLQAVFDRFAAETGYSLVIK